MTKHSPLVPEQHIVVMGNVIDGLTFHGPFDTADDASQWAEVNAADYDDWHLAPLQPWAMDETPTWSPTHRSLLDGSEVEMIHHLNSTSAVVRNENGDEDVVILAQWEALDPADLDEMGG